MSRVLVLEPPYVAFQLAAFAPKLPKVGAVLVIELGNDDYPLLLLDLATAVPWCPVVLAISPNGSTRRSDALKRWEPYPGAWTTVVSDGDSFYTPAAVLRAIRARPIPEPFTIGSWVATRLHAPPLARIVQTACCDDERDSGAVAIGQRNLRRRLREFGLPGPRTWHCLIRLATIAAMRDPLGELSLHDLATQHQLEIRTLRTWIKRFTRRPAASVLKLAGWEWTIEIPLRIRDNRMNRAEPEESGMAAWQQVQAAMRNSRWATGTGNDAMRVDRSGAND